MRQREKTGCLFHLILLPSLLRQVTRKERRERAWCLFYANAASRFSSKQHSNTDILWSKIITMHRKLSVSYKEQTYSRWENSLARDNSVFLFCMIVHPISSLNGRESPSRCTYIKKLVFPFLLFFFVTILYSILLRLTKSTIRSANIPKNKEKECFFYP